MGLGVYFVFGDQWLGMLGMYGFYEVNMVMYGCDLMINIGVCFDDWIIGCLDVFSFKLIKVYIDIDLLFINKVIYVNILIIGDVVYVFEDLLNVWKVCGCKIEKEFLVKWQL